MNVLGKGPCRRLLNYRNTKGGWCLIKNTGSTSINMAGDILTEQDVFHNLKIDKDIQKLYTLFEESYYTQGNKISFPEVVFL